MVPMSLPPASSSSLGGRGRGPGQRFDRRPDPAGVLTRLDLRGAKADLRSLLPAPALGGEGLAESTQAVRAILDRVRAGR